MRKLAVDKPILSWEQTDREFVGVESCKSCHLEEYNQWSQTKHAFAYNTLLRKHTAISVPSVSCVMLREAGMTQGIFLVPLTEVL